MRYVFIINPKAGSENYLGKIKGVIEEYFKDREEKYSIIETEYKGHAEEITKAEAEIGDEVRIYGFGGDGTLLEIARGAANKENAEIGIFPVGSGNDYVKCYGDREAFMNFENQLSGESIYVDGINTNNGVALNICSMGLDAKVAYNMAGFKKIPFVSGPLAYDFAVVKSLLGKRGEQLKITVKTASGELTMEGDYLFALAASGKFYGGGYQGAPLAVTNDGLLDFVLIKNPPLHKIPKLVGIYKNGKHPESDYIKDYLTYVKGYEMEVKSEKPAICNYDGECDVKTEEKFSLVKNMIRFILPKGVTYRA
ncbi:MAG: diacylglycerol kinase family lipid kinase [Clostridia bacterium]|nr:diacylglycerol kinase family lipid kinase [Clostridia bacterium]